MAYSPWGNIQHSRIIMRGMRSVSTDGHGGLMLTKKFAEKHLSESALKRGFRYGEYYCYEEDCAWSIPTLEIKESWDKWYDEDTDAEKRLLETISTYYADYLIERGIAPLEPQYTEYREGKLWDKMNAEKNPDLIVSAWGEWYTKIPGVIQVATADGKKHLIKGEGYGDMNLKLLSKCQIVVNLKLLSDCDIVKEIKEDLA